MGWRNAVFFGSLFGIGLAGLTWAIWLVVTLEPVPNYGIAICIYLFLMGLGLTLLTEEHEHRKVREGARNCGRTTKWDRIHFSRGDVSAKPSPREKLHR
jgi:hypothetical protein